MDTLKVACRCPECDGLNVEPDGIRWFSTWLVCLDCKARFSWRVGYSHGVKIGLPNG